MFPNQQNELDRTYDDQGNIIIMWKENGKMYVAKYTPYGKRITKTKEYNDMHNALNKTEKLKNNLKKWFGVENGY